MNCEGFWKRPALIQFSNLWKKTMKNNYRMTFWTKLTEFTSHDQKGGSEYWKYQRIKDSVVGRDSNHKKEKEIHLDLLGSDYWLLLCSAQIKTHIHIHTFTFILKHQHKPGRWLCIHDSIGFPSLPKTLLSVRTIIMIVY